MNYIGGILTIFLRQNHFHYIEGLLVLSNTFIIFPQRKEKNVYKVFPRWKSKEKCVGVKVIKNAFLSNTRAKQVSLQVHCPIRKLLLQG